MQHFIYLIYIRMKHFPCTFLRFVRVYSIAMPVGMIALDILMQIPWTYVSLCNISVINDYFVTLSFFSFCQKYGLKAARRAPQFSKR